MAHNKTLISFIFVIILELFLQNGNIDNFTCIFIGIIFIILLIEKKFAREKLVNITDDLNYSVEKLSELKEFDNTLFIDAEEIFQNGFLRSALNEYGEKFVFNSKSGKKNNVDISEYINEDAIGMHIRKNITDLMPGVMTALGILGTFIGLTMGLQKFNIGDNTAALTENITGLTNGIKIAFHTSIIGVFMSILYNVFYNKDIDNMKEALQKFYSSFDKIIPDSKNEVLEKLLNYQAVQTEALLSLSNNISTGISDKMAEAIERTIKPQMDGVAQKINTVIGEVKNTLDTYITKTVDSQTQTMQKIVDKFMATLNKALDDQFKNLSVSIEKMCEWQGVTTENIKEINHLMTPLVEELKKQNNIVSENNGKSIEIVRQVESLLRSMKEYTVETAEYINYAKMYAETVNGLNNEIKSEFEDVSKYLSQSEKAFITIGELMETVNEEREKTDKYQESLNVRLNLMDKNAEVLAKSLSGYMDNITKLDDAYKKLISNANSICDKLSHENEVTRKEYSDLVKKLEDTHANNLLKMSDFMKDIQESQEEIIKNTERSVRNIRHNLISVLNNIIRNNSQDNKKED